MVERRTLARSGTESSLALPSTRGQKPLWERIVAKRSYFLMLLPGLLLVLVFDYAPMYGILIAFKDFKVTQGVWDSPWVGLQHFQDFFANPAALRAVKNTLEISLLKIITGTPFPILFALLINELRDGFFKRFVQSASYLPHFISWIVISAIFQSLLLPRTGAVNLVLNAIGLKSIYFMADPAWFRVVLLASNIWKGVGWGSIVYLAALAGVDQEAYEAAIVDGANRLQRMWYISLPTIVPVIFVLLILRMRGILEAGFDQIFNMYNARVMGVADIIDTYVYRMGLVDMEYSFSAAVGLFKSAVGFLLVITANAIAKKVSGGERGLW